MAQQGPEPRMAVPGLSWRVRYEQLQHWKGQRSNRRPERDCRRGVATAKWLDRLRETGRGVETSSSRPGRTWPSKASRWVPLVHESGVEQGHRRLIVRRGA